jgi:uroporphyrin-III C-methyltransferase
MIEGLDITGRRVLVCGGHPAALPVITRLRARGAAVTVVASAPATTVRDLADRGEIAWEEREHDEADVARAALVIAATGTEFGDAAVSALAEEHNRPTIRTTRTPEPALPGIGRVILVGGGPGDPGLLTVAGLDAIRAADVLICDRLAPLEALSEARAGAEIIDVAKIPRGAHTPQDRINELLVEHALAGRLVVRLKGGDNFVFGRGGEEWQACVEAGVAVEIVPGVSASVAAPALAGIPLTHRQLTQGFTVVSGHLPPGDPGSTLDWGALARANTTLVIMMGVATLPAITAELLRHGLANDTPAATVANAGLPGQQTVRGVLSDIADRTAAAGVRPPAVTVIGAVVAFNPSERPRRAAGAPGRE